MVFINNNKIKGLGGIKRALLNNTLIFQSFKKNEEVISPYDITSTFNVTSTTAPTLLCYSSVTSAFTEMAIDGVQVDVTSGYTFDTLGEHTVQYMLEDNTKLGGSTFIDCTRMTEIELPDSITIIGAQAFYNCSSLISIEIPDSVTSINFYAFKNCYSLTSITLPQNLSSNIGTSTFDSCSSLTEIVIPDSVPSISGSSVFSGCTSLQKITIGSGVTSIGTNSAFLASSIFSGCTSLREITCLAPTAPTLLKKSIQGIENNNGVLYVPNGSDYSTWKAILTTWTIQYIT